MIGGIRGTGRFLFFLILINRLSMMGLPFLRGFFSKDLILEGAVQRNFNGFGVLFILLGIMLTM